MRYARGDVLEIGSGPGSNLRHYPDSVSCVTALDPSETMLRGLERKGRRYGYGPNGRCIRTSVGFGERLPFEEQSFDTVVFTLILCTVKDPDTTVREAVRVLKKGGVLIAMEHETPGPLPQRLLFGTIAPIWRLPSDCHLTRNTSSMIDSMRSLRVRSSGRWGFMLGKPFYFRVMERV